MRKRLFFFILLTCSISAVAQIEFEKGYFISNDGQRTECQIRNVDWRDNPKKFDYRMSDTGETIEGFMTNVAEFGVVNGATFRRFDVQMDRSSNQPNNLSLKREPDFLNETLFLRVLVVGKATLYMYKEDLLERYFYSLDGSPVKQLVYKKFLTKGAAQRAGYETTGFGENLEYKQRLLNEMTCSSISKQDVEKLKYIQSDLTNFFARYNTCQGATTSTVVDHGKKKGVTQLTFRPGLTNNSLSITNSTAPTLNRDFGSSMGYRIGFEIESILPYNKGQWSILFEPVYEGFTATSGTAKVNYTTLDFNAGVRRYFFLEGNGKLYLNANIIYGFAMGSTVTYTPGSTLDIQSGINFALAGGYNVNRFSVELRYRLNHNLMGDYVSYSSTYGGPELILGYRLFGNTGK